MGSGMGTGSHRHQPLCRGKECHAVSVQSLTARSSSGERPAAPAILRACRFLVSLCFLLSLCFLHHQ